jgi:hypothetical protein
LTLLEELHPAASSVAWPDDCWTGGYPQFMAPDLSLFRQLKRFPVIADEIRNSNQDKALMFELARWKIAWF